MKKEDLHQLFKKYHDGTATESERAQLEAWYLQYNETGELPSQRKIDAVKNLIFLQLPGNEHGMGRIALKLIAAIALIGILVGVLLTFINYYEQDRRGKPVADILPGGNKATLTLSSGQQINLTDANQGNLLQQGNLTVSKTQNGQVIFKANDQTTDRSNNTITTPKGGQWQVVLGDGTKVWLNSATALTFPTSFAGTENRIVSLRGEAYFEVAKDLAHPFIVISGNQRVEVLGTHFNVNDYPGEPAIRTTLLEGKVRVSLLGSKRSVHLLPGEQAANTGQEIEKQLADTEAAIAWKNGYFRFNDEPVSSIMQKLSRWYDVEVVYADNAPLENLNGKISRNKNISQVIKALEATGTVHFKVEGRRITVMR